MTTVTVTGGCGFIGSHLVDALVKQGHKVVVADALQPNYGYLKNLSGLGVEFKRLNLSSLEDARRAVTGSEIVFHLAAMSHIPVCDDNPLLAVEANYMATANVLEACRSCEVEKVMYAGTDHIYALNGDKIAEDSKLDPVEIYALTKAQSVHLCRLYVKNYGLDVRILVSGNVFGERQDGSKAVPRFIQAALSGKDITVFGGEQSRDFYHVSNLVDAYLLVADKGTAGETYNVGGEEEISVLELARRIVIATNSKSTIANDMYRADECRNTRIHLDISKVKSIGYKEDVGFADGLARTIVWYRTNTKRL